MLAVISAENDARLRFIMTLMFSRDKVLSSSGSCNVSRILSSRVAMSAKGGGGRGPQLNIGNGVDTTCRKVRPYAPAPMGTPISPCATTC